MSIRRGLRIAGAVVAGVVVGLLVFGLLGGGGGWVASQIDRLETIRQDAVDGPALRQSVVSLTDERDALRTELAAANLAAADAEQSSADLEAEVGRLHTELSDTVQRLITTADAKRAAEGQLAEQVFYVLPSDRVTVELFRVTCTVNSCSLESLGSAVLWPHVIDGAYDGFALRDLSGVFSSHGDLALSVQVAQPQSPFGPSSETRMGAYLGGWSGSMTP